MNVLKLRMYLFTLIIGLMLVFTGVQAVASETKVRPMTDEEIISKAKSLGMVDLKEAIEQKTKK